MTLTETQRFPLTAPQETALHLAARSATGEVREGEATRGTIAALKNRDLVTLGSAWNGSGYLWIGRVTSAGRERARQMEEASC